MVDLPVPPPRPDEAPALQPVVETSVRVDVVLMPEGFRRVLVQFPEGADAVTLYGALEAAKIILSQVSSGNAGMLGEEES